MAQGTLQAEHHVLILLNDLQGRCTPEAPKLMETLLPGNAPWEGSRGEVPGNKPWEGRRGEVPGTLRRPVPDSCPS